MRPAPAPPFTPAHSTATWCHSPAFHPPMGALMLNVWPSVSEKIAKVHCPPPQYTDQRFTDQECSRSRRP